MTKCRHCGTHTLGRREGSTEYCAACGGALGSSFTPDARDLAAGERRFAELAREYGDIAHVKRDGRLLRFVTDDGTRGTFDLVNQIFGWPRD